MSLHLRIGPPGSGKTEALLREAREVARSGGRVWWVGLPAQRAHLLRRATRDGPLLGFEPFTLQQLAYRLLADAMRMRPLVIGTGRLALVGEALLEVRSEPPNPGEARLFAYAIAEAKRFGVRPEALPGDDAERKRLRAVYAAYERLKGEQVDYDDVRRDALALAEDGPPVESPALLVVDGLRELGPLDWRLLRALSAHLDVRLALAEAPPGAEPDEKLPAREDGPRACHLFANPVAEARWVLRSLKRDLAEGADPLDLAVILPEREARAFLSLADEYGLPLMDETPRSLADEPRGRRLLDLLELPDHPTASRLLAVPELQPLGAAALDRGLAGGEAVAALADELGLGPVWGDWLRLLEVGGDEMAWARKLLEQGLGEPGGAEPGPAKLPNERFRELALRCAKEAQRVASGAHFRAWWAALLQETLLPDRPPAGIALLGPTQASGRRFRRAYLMRAVQGAYATGETEDYFVPEEERATLPRVFERLGLPRRFQGRDAALLAELRQRADELVVTLPEGDQGGPRLPEPVLLGGLRPEPAPEVPAGSRLELADGDGYHAPREPVPLGAPTLERLRRYDACHFRGWAEGRLEARDAEPEPWWVGFRRELCQTRSLSEARRAELAQRWPRAATWLSAHATTLSGLTFGVRLGPDDGPVARLDAARREDGVAVLVRFVGPDDAPDAAAAAEALAERWNEWWAAGWLLERHRHQVQRVHLRVWPIGGDGHEVVEGGLQRPDARVRRSAARAGQVLRAWRAGDVEPKPGFLCRDCAVFDLCREGRR